jgi:sulfonate transport system permease protein
MMRPTARDRLRNTAVPWLLPVAILLGWQAAVSAGLVSNRFMPAPLDVVRAGWEAGRTGELWTNLWVSTLRALSGFAVGGGIGFALGLANGLSRLSEQLTDTSVQMVRNVPHLSLIPLVILWFGIGEEAEIVSATISVSHMMPSA